MLLSACFGGGVAASGALALAWRKVWRCASSLIADRDTGEQRRRSCPPALDISANYLPGCYEAEAWKGSELKNERGFLTLRNGQNIFYQTWAPVSDDVVAIVVLFHGFGDHCDFQGALKAKTICSMGRFAAVAFDLPGHGRSDGLIAHIPCWFEFIDAAREVVVEHLPNVCFKRYPGTKMFGLGESMGGGVLFSLLARERELFDGAILICPMLFVSRDMFPPWIVVQFFKYVMVPLLPLWPISPNKDIGDACNADPAVLKFVETDAEYHNRISVGKAKPRLGTGYQLAFASGDWMQSKISAFDVPALIIHGGADAVTDALVSKRLFDEMKNPDKEFLYPDGVWHADLFHAGPKQYDAVKERFEKVVRWMEKRS